MLSHLSHFPKWFALALVTGVTSLGAAPAPFSLPSSGGTTLNINIAIFGLHICAAGSCDSECNSIETVVAVIMRWVLQSAYLSVSEIP